MYSLASLIVELQSARERLLNVFEVQYTDGRAPTASYSQWPGIDPLLTRIEIGPPPQQVKGRNLN
jgi:hypothetical protein